MVKINLKEKINRKSLITICSAILFILIVIILIKVLDKSDEYKPTIIDNSQVKYITVSEEISDDPNRVEISGKKMAKKHCFEKICVSDVEILCYENTGIINYTIWNTGKKASDVNLKIKIDDFSGYIVIDKLKPGNKYRGHIGYEGFDLRKTKSYKLKEMSEKEKKNVIK